MCSVECGLANGDCGFLDWRFLIEIDDCGLRGRIFDLELTIADLRRHRRIINQMATVNRHSQSSIATLNRQSQSSIATLNRQSTISIVNRQS
jgi:hypothetical protein